MGGIGLSTPKNSYAACLAVDRVLPGEIAGDLGELAEEGEVVAAPSQRVIDDRAPIKMRLLVLDSWRRCVRGEVSDPLPVVSMPPE